MKTKVIIFSAALSFAAAGVSGQAVITDGRVTGSNTVLITVADTVVPAIPASTFVSDQDVPTRDVVVADDQIVTGSIGVGFDCADGEVFGFNTVLLKENNLRIKFDDTSLTPGFPANDWTLVANDAGSGGTSYFAIEDATAAIVPFKLMAGAPADALNIDSNGKVGFCTAAPQMSIHTVKGDTPGLRLEQNTSSGWTAQTWDLAGNEANFFIRDVTNGSALPFRIQPGSPTNSLTVLNTGNVGIGTWTPTEKLEVNGSMKLTAILTAPAAPSEGSMYMDGNDHLLKYYDGAQWSTVSANTDEQSLLAATLTGSILQIDIENGSSVSVDLSPLLADLEARVAALEAWAGLKESVIEKASMFQNSPNPFTEKTSISYFIPADVNSASLVIYNVKGVKIKEYPITKRGEGALEIAKDDLKAGSYFYSLVLDGAKAESKIMIKVE